MERRSFIKLAGSSLVAAAAVGALSACGAREVVGLATSNGDGTEDILVANQPDISFSTEVDVLIIGSGIAGLSAAMAPGEAGYSVMVAEKLDLFGGESYEANGVMHIAGSNLQLEAGLTSTAEEAWDEMESELTERGVTDLDFAKTLFLTSPQWVDHLVDVYKSEFADPAEYIEKGVSKTILLPKKGLGDMESVMLPLRDNLANNGVILQAGYRAVACIVTESGTVCGARFVAGTSGSVIDVQASRVIIATGGFASSPTLMDQYLPTQEHIGCYTVASMGEGLTLCMDAGGQLADMDVVPPLTSDIPQATTWGLFGPTLIVDALGHRFTREDVVNAAPDTCFSDELGFWWTIFDDQLDEGIQSNSLAVVSSKNATRFIGPCDNLETLAASMGIPTETLKETFKSYEEQVEAGEDKDFNRIEFLKKLNPPYYAVKQFPVRFKTLGGIQTNDSGQVLDVSGAPIPHLYCCGAAAAGNVVGLASAGPFGMKVGQAVVDSLKKDEADA